MVQNSACQKWFHVGCIVSGNHVWMEIGIVSTAHQVILGYVLFFVIVDSTDTN